MSNGYLHITYGAKKNCYALGWSYGEICVGCGCCSNDPVIRLEARIAYHEWELENNKNFDGWFEDDPDMVALQKRNVIANIRYAEDKIKEYKEELERVKVEKSGA